MHGVTCEDSQQTVLALRRSPAAAPGGQSCLCSTCVASASARREAAAVARPGGCGGVGGGLLTQPRAHTAAGHAAGRSCRSPQAGHDGLEAGPRGWVLGPAVPQQRKIFIQQVWRQAVWPRQSLGPRHRQPLAADHQPGNLRGRAQECLSFRRGMRAQRCGTSARGSNARPPHLPARGLRSVLASRAAPRSSIPTS